MKKKCLKTSAFLWSIFFDFSSILAPKLSSKKQVACRFFSDLEPKRRPRGPKSAPRRFKRRPRRIFDRFWLPFWKVFDIIFYVFCDFFFIVFGFRSCTRPGSCASLLSLPFRFGGDIPRQSPPLVWRGRLPGVPVRLSVLFCTLFSIIF